MYTLDAENVREVAEACAGGSEFEQHALYALRFMVNNVFTPLGVDRAYTTDGKDGISSGLFQKLTGDKTYYLGFVDLHEGLTAIAKGFAGDQYEDDREFILDATGEFINRINGEFVIASAKSGVNIEIEPQLYLEEDEVYNVIQPVRILHIPVTFNDSKAEMLFVTV